MTTGDPEPHKVTLNAGMLLPVRLVDGLSSEHAAPGDAFPATLDKELVVDGFAIAERGAVWGRLLICGRVGGALWARPACVPCARKILIQRSQVLPRADGTMLAS